MLAYVICLAAKSRRKELVALLPEERRSEIEAIRKELKESTREGVRRRLETVRSDQLAVRWNAVEERTGLALHQLSPRLRSWLVRPF